MVSVEFGFATACILDFQSRLKKICFTDTPLGYDKFNSKINLSLESFVDNLYNNPSFQNELAYLKKNRILPDSGAIFGFTSEKDFYYDLKEMYDKIMFLKNIGGLVIGLESLLNNNKNKFRIFNRHIFDDER